jgi:hypothetical protein
VVRLDSTEAGASEHSEGRACLVAGQADGRWVCNHRNRLRIPCKLDRGQRCEPIPLDVRDPTVAEESVEGIVPCGHITLFDEGICNVGPPDGPTGGMSGDIVVRDAVAEIVQLLDYRNIASVPADPQRLKPILQRPGPWLKEVDEHVHLLAVVIDRKFDAGDEIETGTLASFAGFSDAVEVVVISKGDARHSLGDGQFNDLCRRVGAVRCRGMQMEVDCHLLAEEDLQRDDRHGEQDRVPGVSLDHTDPMRFVRLLGIVGSLEVLVGSLPISFVGRHGPQSTAGR